MRSNSYFQFFNHVFSALLCLSILQSFAPFAAAQTKKSNPATAIKQTTPKCAGGWSGVVTYKRTLKDSLESDEPGIRKSIDRIKHKTSRDYDYTARAVVDGKTGKRRLLRHGKSRNEFRSFGRRREFEHRRGKTNVFRQNEKQVNSSENLSAKRRPVK